MKKLLQQLHKKILLKNLKYNNKYIKNCKNQNKKIIKILKEDYWYLFNKKL